MENEVIHGNDINPEIYVTTSKKTIVHVNVSASGNPNAQLYKTFSVIHGQTQLVKLNTSLRLHHTELTKKAVLIEADDEIVVYVVNREERSDDAYLALPIDVLGKEYYTVSYSPASHYCLFAIIGVYDKTNVSIHLPDVHHLSVTLNGNTYHGDQWMNVTLDRLSTLQVRSKHDLTGSHIVSSKPIAVLSGNKKTTVGHGDSRDHLVEMLLPLSSWGSNFATVPIPDRHDKGDIFRFIASEDNTHVHVSGINSGKPFQDIIKLEKRVITSKNTIVPDCLVSQMIEGDKIDNDCDGEIDEEQSDGKDGDVKPSPDQYLTHLELYNSIDSCKPKSHLKGLQRVRGMWRIYPDSDIDRETLITNNITVRHKLINVYSANPKSSEYSTHLYLRVRVKDVPCSADDGQILRAIESEGKCSVHKLNRERLRVDGLLTNCQTGDRILFCDPLENPLPRIIKIGKYRAMVFHKDQIPSSNDTLVCNKCLQNGHRFRDCQNDWVCKQCKLPGHKQADCPSFDAQNEECNSMPHDNDKKKQLLFRK
ncbi:unnamed protein product [Mytilus edulis]|uniref:CCHC-type domain-containing protein n=1 Tax=Mytilus edulis TaxID=6550 RepID=A0A8S3RCH1_MYTED|nr:unnamed protein product [Mytilus edulis]